MARIEVLAKKANTIHTVDTDELVHQAKDPVTGEAVLSETLTKSELSDLLDEFTSAIDKGRMEIISW